MSRRVMLLRWLDQSLYKMVCRLRKKQQVFQVTAVKQHILMPSFAVLDERLRSQVSIGITLRRPLGREMT